MPSPTRHFDHRGDDDGGGDHAYCAVNELNVAIAAATTVAAAWRGEAARVQLEVQHNAATTMQRRRAPSPCRRTLTVAVDGGDGDAGGGAAAHRHG